MTNVAYISIGSNLGNKLANCFNAISKIEATKHSSVLNCSNFYLTSPTDYKKQNWFVNSVIKIKTTLKPYELLYFLIATQYEIGRKINKIRYGPRKLDLDIIFYEDKSICLF